MRYAAVINVDWLQVHCRSLSTQFPQDSSSIFCDPYEWRKSDYGTPVFSELYHVYDHTGDHYAEVQCCPRSTLLVPNTVIVKLANRELYKAGYIERLGRFLQQYDLRFMGISRIDICCDQNRFCLGQDPQQLIRDFMASRILKNGLSKYQVRGMSNNITGFSYLAFGSPASAVRAYLYDKTKELREVKDKPYIRQVWRDNGIDENKPVWRVEISIKSDRTTLVKYDTGEIFRLSIDDIVHQRAIEQLFIDYSRRYFAFKHNDGTSNKSRMRDVVIFSAADMVTTRPIQITLANDMTRTDKVILKGIDHMINEIRYPDEEDIAAINRVLYLFMSRKSLSRYYAEKLKDHREPRSS